ncbi:unnamed protein product, partial [Leptidea sinapis]
YLEIVKIIFPFVSNINQTTDNGVTPLILATQGCSLDTVKFLLLNDADPYIKNNSGLTALLTALEVGHSDIFRIILETMDISLVDRNIIMKACKPHYFKLEILECLLDFYHVDPDFFDFYEQVYFTLEKIGDIMPNYVSNSPVNSYLNICEYIYKSDPQKFKEFFNLFLIGGPVVNPLDANECPPIVYIHYCMHTHCFQEVFRILTEHGCNVDYCSYAMCVDKDKCIPDAFIASITADTSTIPIMLPYSLYCEPGYLLQFAIDNGVIGRLSENVQDQIISMIGYNTKDVSAEKLAYVVHPLKHLCRLKIRSLLRKAGTQSTRQYFVALNALRLPQLLKNYLRYSSLDCSF